MRITNAIAAIDALITQARRDIRSGERGSKGQSRYDRAKGRLVGLEDASVILLEAAGKAACPRCKREAPGLECERCRLYQCSGCKAWKPWSDGAADDMPAVCDDCWAKAHEGEAA